MDTIRSGLNLDKNQDIDVDCDAFSFIISYDEDTPHKRSAIKRLLLHFGTDWTSVTFPPIAAAIQTAKTGNQDSLFGSEHSKSCVEGINDALHLSEVLIIDTPVKIALHASCKQAIKVNIEKMGFAVRLSSSFGICFDHQKSTNKPPYGRIIDAILDSSHIGPLKKHVIHIGNVGMRHPIRTVQHMDPGNARCHLQQMFKLIQEVRLHGIVVETTQLDIAYNIKFYDLLQFSSTKLTNTMPQPKKMSRPSVLSNLSPDVWPIHNLVTKEGGGLETDRLQKGTLRVKRPKIDRSQLTTVLEGDMEEDHNLGDQLGDDTFVALLRRIYSCYEENTSTCQKLVMNLFAIHSVKFYSTLAHFLSPYKQHLPIDRSTMNRLHSCSMIKLQRFLNVLESLSKDSIGQLCEHGIHARIEVSVRPGIQNDTTSTNGATLRPYGHLVDILSHVFAGIHDVLNHHKYKINLETLSPRRVYSECLFLARTVRSFVNLRAETPFDKVYTDAKKHCWLRAVMCLIMTKVGYAHDFKLTKIKQWLSSQYYFDPGEIGHSLENGLPLRILTNQNACEDQSRSALLSPSHNLIQYLSEHLKKINLTANGVDIIITMVCKNNPNYRFAYQQLSLLDKLRMAQHLNNTILPNLGNLLSHPKNGNNPDIDTRDQAREESHQDELFVSDWYNQHHQHIDDNWTTSHLHLLHQYNSQHGLRFRSVRDNTNPVMLVMESLYLFSKMFDPRYPTFLFQLFHYIELCHERSLKLPCMMTTTSLYLQPLPQHSKSLISRLHNFLQFSSDKHVFLREVCSELKITPPHISTETMITSLCEHYLYPCLWANYDVLFCQSGNQSHLYGSVDARTEEQLKNLNFLLHHSSNKVFVHRLPSSDPTVTKFYRSIDELYISIKKPSQLLTSHHHQNLRVATQGGLAR